MSGFKILFLYPNGKLMNPPAVSIGLFTALLKQNGFEVALFDTTLYSNRDEIGSDEAKQDNLQVRPFDYAQRGIKLKETMMEDDLIKKIGEFRPDLIAVSVLESTYPTALRLLRAIDGYKIPIVVGGVFATFAPEIVISNKDVTMVCIAEGEVALIELCKRMATGEDYSNVENLWVKKGNEIIKNGLRSLVDINKQPMPDYSLFEKERFFRPMAGKVYKTVPIETERGCPYACTFCNSPSTAKLYRESQARSFFRKKKMQCIQQELRYLIKKWDAEYIYFTADTFLAISNKEFDEFADIYSEFKLPFWLQSRAETITEYRAKRLKEIGCHRISLGLEHGNNDFRKRVLKKQFDNDQIIKASKVLADVGIPLTVNNIIGFPDETRELIFDTIELNRQLLFDTTNCSIFAPFHGTPLHKLCVEREYISADFNPGSINVDASLTMPQLSREEIKGLRRTFALYARMPKEYWPKIQIAEKFDEEGNREFSELKKIYQENYFNVDNFPD
ncbi:MAG TPA: B12-binding domain-containing radical SAM protein [Candidatus Wunengus sp. YC65]|uniref:B12-binding domain-containing radical SAM protein n=1 Tax=Candidatus Wunengus sp. YC65 TaxID=3367701 RepID=UPI004027BCD4